MPRGTPWPAGGSSIRCRRGAAASRPERLAALAALAEPDAGDALEKLVETRRASSSWRVSRWPATCRTSDIETLAEVGGFAPPRRRTHSRSRSARRGSARLGDSLIAALGQWHAAQADALGHRRAALFRRLRGEAPEAALDAALAQLQSAGKVVRDGAVLRLAEHQPRLSREDERLWKQVHPLLAADGICGRRGSASWPRELALQPEPLTRFLRRIERFGRVAQVAPNRFFLPETLARLAEIARELAEASPEGRFTAAEFKDRSGIGRNLTIEVLEYLDRIGVTRRDGDARTVLRSPAAVFG